MASRVIAKTSGSASSSASWMRSFSFLRRAAASSRRRSTIGVVQLVVGRLVRDRDLADLGAQHVEASADLGVRQRLELRFELVRLIDCRLDPFELAIVRVDEAVQEAKHGPTV